MPSFGSIVQDPTKRSGCSVSARSDTGGLLLALIMPTATPCRSISCSVSAIGSAPASRALLGTSRNMYDAGIAKSDRDSSSRKDCLIFAYIFSGSSEKPIMVSTMPTSSWAGRVPPALVMVSLPDRSGT